MMASVCLACHGAADAQSDGLRAAFSLRRANS
jgi:hypothetical protein